MREEEFLDRCEALAEAIADWPGETRKSIYTAALAEAIIVTVSNWPTRDDEALAIEQALGHMQTELRLAELLLKPDPDSIADIFNRELGIESGQTPSIEAWKKAVNARFQTVADEAYDTGKMMELLKESGFMLAKCGRTFLNEESTGQELAEAFTDAELARATLESVYYPFFCGHELSQERILEAAEKRLDEISAMIAE